jgi:pyruvate/2-oxoglutarate dehydrogenase complex dihydrolipoamide acyltransferase (E2) component
MRKPILLPELGAAPAVLSVWFAEPGEPVFEGDRLVEVLVGGATFDVSAPATGYLAEKCVFPDEALSTGQILGVVEVDAEDTPARRASEDGPR